MTNERRFQMYVQHNATEQKWAAVVPDLNLSAVGATRDEVIEKMRDAIRAHVLAERNDGTAM
jgi:predicted RNase H-like HicB family nuclease